MKKVLQRVIKGDILISRAYQNEGVESYLAMSQKIVTADPVVDVSEVDSYVTEHFSSKESYTPDVFHNAAPPFTCAVLYCKGTDYTESGIESAIVTSCLDRREAGKEDDFGLYEKLFSNIVGKEVTGSRWLVQSHIFSRELGSVGKGRMREFGCDTVYAGSGAFLVLEDGEVARHDEGNPAFYNVSPFQRKDIPQDIEEMLRSFGSNIGAAMLRVIHAFTFMNCKNVEVVEKKPSNLEKNRMKKKKLPALSIYTLDIRPVKKFMESEGRVSTEGYTKALHTCRGHFKDFRNGRGLFGKHRDVYWWGPQLRGSQSAGAVEKDYRVLTK